MKKIFFILSMLSLTTFFMADAQVRITKVDPVGNSVTLKNFGTSTVSVTTYWLCNQISYVQLAGLTPTSGSPFLVPGAEVTYPRLLADAGSDVGLYSASGFSNAANMLDFMQYGGSFPFPSGRENVAVTAGIWTAGEFISGSGPYDYFGDGTTTGASEWGVGVEVTFQVDLALESAVSDSGVHITGSFQGFDPGADEMTNTGGTSYSYTTILPVGDTVRYKYVNGNAFDGSEETATPLACAEPPTADRVFIVPAVDTVLPEVCFEACVSCSQINSVNVTFQVDMANEIVSPNGVHVAGNFQGFNPSSDQLTNIGGTVYATTIAIPLGTPSLIYKFINGNDFAFEEEVTDTSCAVSDGFGGLQRETATPTSDTTLPVVCFSSCGPCDNPVNVTFQVNMSNELAISDSGVHLAGSFQGFDPGSDEMTDLGGGIYAITFSLSKGTPIQWKYINGNAFDGSEEIITDTACAVNDGFGNLNRGLTVPETDTILPVVCFGECENCESCPTPQNLNETNLSATTVTLNWEQSANAVGYEIRGGVQGSNPANYVVLTVSGGSTTSFNVINLTPNLSFEWTVRAICSPDQSVVSDFAPLSFFSTTCPVPGTAFTTNVTASSATLNWSVAAGALGYEVVGQALGGPLVTLIRVGNANTTFQVNNLPGNTAFQWQVRSICTANGSAKSVFTNSSQFTTLGATEKTGLGLQDAGNALNAVVYPNPAGNQLNIQLATEESVVVQLFDLNGRLITSNSASNGTLLTMDVSHVQNGVYQLIINGKSAYHVEKLVIAR